jgi:VWFA-related protein
MPRSLRSTLILSGSLCLPFLQAGGQTPQPGSDGGQQIYHLNETSQEVVVDVVVTDDRGQPVHGLQRNDFRILEGKVPQNIRGFYEHEGLTAQQQAKIQPMPKLPPGTFTNYSPAVDSDQALNILLIDSLNTATKDQSFVRQQLKKYLNTAKPGTRVAIFGLTTHLVLLQGFTADPSILRDIIDKKNPVGSVLLDDPNGGGMDSMQGYMGDDPEMASVVSSVNDFESEEESFQTSLRTTYTLEAMSELARYLASMPGRKNLIWFSSAFPVNILPDGDLNNPFSVASSNDEQYRETVNLLARAQVAVYPVDAAGLEGSSVFSASASGRSFGKNITNFGAATQADLNQKAEAHMTMLQMAEATGGHVYINTNGLSQAVKSAIDTGDNYYTLTYAPKNANWNGDYRNIKVVLDRPNYTLAYRRGYYADDPDAEKHSIEEATDGDIPPSDPQSLGMMRGAPDPTQITMKVMVLPSTAPPQPDVANGNALNPSIKVKGPFKNYEITIAANPADVSFPSTTKGNRFAALEFITYVYDQDGGLIVLKDDHAHDEMTPQKYSQMLHGSIYWHQEISVPVKGQYYLRIGIHDMLNDKMGGVEVPISAVAKLPPVAPVQQPSAKVVPAAAGATK